MTSHITAAIAYRVANRLAEFVDAEAKRLGENAKEKNSRVYADETWLLDQCLVWLESEAKKCGSMPPDAIVVRMEPLAPANDMPAPKPSPATLASIAAKARLLRAA